METTKKRVPEAWVSESINEIGLGSVVVARFKGSGDAEVGVFLLDLKCLGVKDAFLARTSVADYEGRVLGRIREQGRLEAISPGAARELVEDAVAYGRSLGLEPYVDYRLAQRVFGGIAPEPGKMSFTFGDQGKPLYVQGPNDSPEFAWRVVAHLRRRCGPEGFHFVVGAGETGVDG